MMKKIFLVLIITFYSISLRASFIAGGNVTMSHVSGYNYSIELDLYFDDIAAAPGLVSEDSLIVVAIYEKITNALMDTIILQKISKNIIPYIDSSNTNCLSTVVRTRLEKYVIANNSQTIELDPSIYNSANGYYIVWERCCREVQTVNIENASNDIGMAFYMEFPANSLFIDSSPKPITYMNGLAFVGAPYSLNLACTDSDDDSLAYSLVTPLAGHATANGYGPGAEPIPPYPAPYPLVTWAAGYSATNAIHGTPSLSVNSATGMLSVTPSEAGLFSFAVLCEEYRDRVKIGEIREDFFLWVVVADSGIVCNPTTGIAAANSLDVILYPNPASGIVYFSSNTSSEFTYEVLTTVGATILSGTGNSFTTAAIKPGIYFVKINSGGLSSIQKLIVE